MCNIINPYKSKMTVYKTNIFLSEPGDSIVTILGETMYGKALVVPMRTVLLLFYIS
jgi:hypothetical protein